jgi:hypothetical protein
MVECQETLSDTDFSTTQKKKLFVNKLLTVLGQSMIKRLPNSLCPVGRIHPRTHEYKLGKGNTKGNMIRSRWNLEAKRACF